MRKYLALCAVVALAFGVLAVTPEPVDAKDKTKVEVCHHDHKDNNTGHIILVNDEKDKVQKHIDAHGDCTDADITHLLSLA